MNQKLGFSAGALAVTLVTLIILIPFGGEAANEVLVSVTGTATPIPPPTPTATPVPPTTLVLSPITSLDDGYEDYTDPTINTGSSSNIVGSNTSPGNRNVTAIRFQNVAIAQGQVIDTADLTMWATATGHGLQNAHVFAFDKDDQAAGLTQIIAETWTSANVLWDELVQVNDNVSFTSPELKTIIQEIVDRPGWVSGNSLVIVIDGDDNGDIVNMFSDSYDSGVSAQYPDLSITFQP